MRIGRPAKLPTARRSETLHVRLSPGEADAVCRLAARRGVSLATVVRAGLRRLLHESRGEPNP
jgi:predicted HicB family RNase H-like nuclease